MYDAATLAGQLRRLVELDLDEDAEDALIAEIGANVPDPEWMGAVFHSRGFERPDGTLDYDAVSAHILSYRAIRL
ncbi:hypothetical protein HKCCE4037_12365 [Rhodobacterales bacterium HKCCE4037]|nr:hypothetical protein [Rhodobacterales bacterium HKCCE4037]